MADNATDPLTGVPTGDETLAPDYLGKMAPLLLKSQPALPVAGPAAAGAGPTGIPGARTSSPLTTGSAGSVSRPGTAGPGGTDTLAQALNALGLGEKVLRLLPKNEREGGGGLSEAMRGAIGPNAQTLDEQASELSARLLGGAAGPSSFGDVDPALLGLLRENLSTIGAGGAAPLGAAIEPAAVAGQGSADALSGALGTAEAGAGSAIGQAVPYAGAVTGIILDALAGNKPAYQQALDAGIDVAGAALAAPTGGLSLLAAPVAKAHAGSELKYINEGNAPAAILNADPVLGIANTIPNLFGFDLFGSLFGGSQGSYVPKRQHASETANQSLDYMAQNYASLSGDLPGVQRALSLPTGDPHVGVSLFMAPETAQQIGFPFTEGDVRGGRIQVGWDRMSPEQFGKMVDAYASNPGSITLEGHGDVPYLPYDAALSVSHAAEGATRQLLDHATKLREFERMQQQAQEAQTAATTSSPPPEPATMGGGGVTAPVAQMSAGGGGSRSGLTTEDVNQIVGML